MLTTHFVKKYCATWLLAVAVERLHFEDMHVVGWVIYYR